jgi:hypothetical protein
MNPGELLHYNYRIPGNSPGVTFTVNYFNTNTQLCRNVNCGPTIGDACAAQAAGCYGLQPCNGQGEGGGAPCFGHGGVILDLGSGEVIETVGIYGYSDINNNCWEEYLAPLTAFVSPNPQKTCDCPSSNP